MACSWLSSAIHHSSYGCSNVSSNFFMWLPSIVCSASGMSWSSSFFRSCVDGQRKHSTGMQFPLVEFLWCYGFHRHHFFEHASVFSSIRFSAVLLVSLLNSNHIARASLSNKIRSFSALFHLSTHCLNHSDTSPSAISFGTLIAICEINAQLFQELSMASTILWFY